MRVSEIMTRDPISVGPDVSAKEIAELMLEKSAVSVIVVENGRPAGIVTERDLIWRCLAVDRNLDLTKAGDICSKPVVAVTEFMEVEDAVDTTTEYRIRRVVVVDSENKIMGTLTTDEIGQI